MSARDERAAHTVRQSEVRHADTITAVKMAYGEPLAASQHRSHSMQRLSKASCVIFARPHITHQRVMLQLKIPPKSTSLFPLAFRQHGNHQ